MAFENQSVGPDSRQWVRNDALKDAFSPAVLFALKSLSMSFEELRAEAARYRALAQECCYPEGVQLLVMMADVHEEEAAQAAPTSEPRPFLAGA